MSDAHTPLSRVPEWRVTAELMEYPEAVEEMNSRAAAIAQGQAPELLWLLQHPPLYTAGTSAQESELLRHDLPVYATGRGGRHTWHGPGQRVVYVLLDLSKRGQDVRGFVQALEGWVIAALAVLGVAAFSAPGRIGIWVNTPRGEEKIGAIGVRVRKWVTLHGFAVNVAPDLSHFSGIIPCGISDYGVTSLAALGVGADMHDFDAALEKCRTDFLASLPHCG
jgi:lipoyl(octanoyl) transferase